MHVHVFLLSPLSLTATDVLAQQGAMHLIASPEVRDKELHLSEEQVDQVLQTLKRHGKSGRVILYTTLGVPREWVETLSEFQKHTEEELQMMMEPNVSNVELRMKVIDGMMELNATSFNELKGVLTDSQYDRLEQLSIQRVANHPDQLLRLLAQDAQVARAIGMSEKEIQSAKREYRAFEEAGISGRVRAPFALRKLSLKLLASLTDEQSRRLRTLGGKESDVVKRVSP